MIPITDSTGAKDPVFGRFRRPTASDLQDDGGLLSRAIARAKAGDESAVHFLYVRFADDVLGYTQSIVRNRHDAEDVTHTVFAKLIIVIGQYEQRDSPFSAWILRVARNAALDHVRGRRQIPFEDVRSSDNGHGQVGFERSLALKAALARLPPDQRTVLVLRHIAGLSPVEIAQRLGKSEASVHGHHHRGRAALCAALSELGATPLIRHEENGPATPPPSRSPRNAPQGDRSRARPQHARSSP